MGLRTQEEQESNVGAGQWPIQSLLCPAASDQHGYPPESVVKNVSGVGGNLSNTERTGNPHMVLWENNLTLVHWAIYGI